MIVCDICKSPKYFEIKMPVIKTETSKGRTKDRTVIEPKLDLCEQCLTKFLKRVGNFVISQRNNGSLFDSEDSDAPGPEEEGASTLEESETAKAEG